MTLATKPKPPASVHHKKRHGHHHKRTKAYEKSYWPYLPMLAVVGLGMFVNTLWTQPGGSVLAYATSMNTTDLLQATNAQRSSAGQGSLAINQQLMNAAQAKANDMAARNYWSHVTPDGRQPWWFVENAGYEYQATGENLAYGFDTSQAAITGWMNSPGHKANLLNGVYQDVGFGIANAADYQGHGQQTIVVALYGKLAAAVDAVAAAPPASQPAPAEAPTAAATEPAPLPSEPAPPAATAPPAPQLTLQPSVPATAKPATTEQQQLASQPVTRLQLVAAEVSPWTVLATTTVVALAAAIFILRHIVFWHRALAKGERFIIRHWKADLVIVALVVTGSLLLRTAGFVL